MRSALLSTIFSLSVLAGQVFALGVPVEWQFEQLQSGAFASAQPLLSGPELQSLYYGSGPPFSPIALEALSKLGIQAPL
jgi:hypothetical protein